jgi:hypothetical protein
MRSTRRIKKLHFNGELDKKGVSKKATTIFSPLKRLTSKYRGNLVKVLRNSDDAVKWFGCDFKGNIKSTKILIWLNGSDGLVSEVVNQARPNDNFTQSTKANMPKIVESSVLNDKGLNFDGTNDGFTCNSDGLDDTTLQLFTIYTYVYQTSSGNKRMLTKNIAGNDYSYSLGSRTTNDHYWHIVRTSFGYGGLTPNPLMKTIVNSHVEMLMIRDRGNSRTRRIKNLIEYTANVVNGAIDYNASYPLYISGAALGEYFEGYMKYVVILKNAFSNLSLVEDVKYILDYDNYYSKLSIGVSLTRLTKWYTGACIRIRRSSDDNETDIGFSGSFVDKAAIEDFCGGGDGFVTIWYDQSTNNNNFTQATTDEQPKICDSGTFVENGIDFDGTNDNLTASTGTSTIRGIYINFLTRKLLTGQQTGNTLTFSITGTYGGLRFGNTTGYLTGEVIAIYTTGSDRSGWIDASGTVPIDTIHKLLCTFDSATPKWDINLDGSQKSITTVNTPVALTNDAMRIGGRIDDGGDWLDGNCKSFLLFNDDDIDYSYIERL